MTRLARYDQRHLATIVTPETVHFVLQQLIRRTMHILTRSGELAKLQITSLSIDRIAAQFSSMLPESFPGQNLNRASSLVGNKHHDQQRNLLHMLIYLASNHLVLDYRNNLEYNLRTAETLVLLFRLGSPVLLHNLIQFSRESVTLAATVEELFQAAIITDALDVVANILDTNPWMITLGIDVFIEWPIGVLLPLHYAAFQGSVDLVNLLVKFQADVNEVSYPNQDSNGWTPLALAACRSPYRVSSEIANLLLQNNAVPNPQFGHAPLLLCLSRGNVPLALQLIQLGAADSIPDSIPVENLGQANDDFFFAEGVCATLVQRAKLLSTVSVFGFAICVTNASYADDAMDNLDELVVLRLLKALQVATKSHCGSDAMILAASRGHLQVLTYLRTELGQTFDSINGALSPLYAAVLWGQVHAAKQLLEWGASASLDSRLHGSWMKSQFGLPTPLHIAIQSGSSDMVRLLIQYGGKVNQTSMFFANIYSGQWNPSRWRPTTHDFWHLYSSDRMSTCFAVPPLLFSALQECWDDTETLLALGAEPSGDVLFEVARRGQLGLVARLLENGVRPDESSRWGVSALAIAAAEGHEPVVFQLLQAGATVFDTSFAALFCLSDVSIIRALLQTRSEWPKLRDERTNRSYLENAILYGTNDVVDLALQFDQDYYDSGALCAATSQDIMAHTPDTYRLLNELLTRRERAPYTKTRIQLHLESTAVSMAALYDKLDTVELLLRSNIPGFHQATGVQIPCWGVPLARNRRICNQWHTSQEPDASPLEYAAMGQSERVSLRLLQEGYCPDVRSIFAAISYLKGDVVEKFIEQCENVNMVVQYWTLLQEAVRMRNMKLVERLLAKDADVNTYELDENDFPTDWGYPALTIAAKVGDLDLVSLLLKNGADVNRGHSSGAESTAIQLAVAKGHISIVKCLIAHNADMYARRYPVAGLRFTGHGTPLEEASRWGRLDIVHLLLGSGLSTSGYHRVQFVLSIIYAQQSGHHTVVQALYNHRPWSAEDQEIYQELTEFPANRKIFFHPKEYPEAEFLGTIKETLRQLGLRHTSWRWWKDVPLIRGIGLAGDIANTDSDGSADETNSDEEVIIEDSAEESQSSYNEAFERMDENFSAGLGIEDAIFRSDSITPFNENGKFGSHEPYSIFPQAEASRNADYSNVSWPCENGPERPGGNESNIPMESDSQTSQYQFEGDNPSLFRPVGEIMDAFDPSLWPSNDVLTDIFEWPAENEVNVSTDLSNWNLDPTFNGWQQDADSGMAFEDMFDLSEWL